jgi:PAS domain S-box-containing protein
MTASEPRRHTEELRRSEERFRLLVEGVTDYGIFMLDPDGRVASWNAGAERIKGYKASDIIGKHFSVFYPEEARARKWPETELERAREIGRFEDEGWRVRKDGSQFWANVVITAIRDEKGELLGFSKITRDLTNRRRQEEELRQAEERLRLMVEAVQDYAIFMLDPSGHVSSWNTGAQRLKGYAPEDIIGKHFSVFYPPEALARKWPEHELEVAKATGRFEDEGWRIRKDGTRFWANVIITAVHDASGELRGFAKVTRDLTETKRAERIQEEGRQITEFLAMLSHELRNPLAPIRNAVALMSSKEVEDPTIAWARDLIERQVGHLSHLVDDLLDVSRITSGKINLKRERVDFTAIVSRAIEATRPLLEQRHHGLEVDLGSEPVYVQGDQTRLNQVVLNLLSNAAKYTPEGGHVWVRVAREGELAVLAVRDDGIGMDADLVPRVFELFTQGERSLDRSEGGLGIGLTMVHRLVSLQGGSVAASSRGLGLGSEFVVRLPVAGAPERAAGEPASADASAAQKSRAGGLRVLVVDDNQDATDTMAMLLRMWGHDVVTAVDGVSAVAEALRYHPDVVLLDIGLPRMNGYEVAERLRAEPTTRDVVLVAMTGYGQAEDRERSRSAGFGMHLVKPVQPDALEALLKSIASRAAG